MDSGRELIIIAVALAVACCIVGSAVYLSSDHDGGDGAVTDEDYIGCWYLVQTVRSYNDGTMVDVSVGDSDDAFLSDRCLHLFSVDSGLVYGTYREEGITGYVLGDQVLLYFAKHGNYAQFMGYLTDGFMVLVNAHSDLDADGDVATMCAGISVYSRDPARPLMDMSGICPDLSGEWKVSFGRVVTKSFTEETYVTGMNIDWMKDGVFTGTVSIDRDGAPATVAVKGSMAPCGNVYSGLMCDMMYGGSWGLTYHDGIFRVATSDVEIVEGEAGGEEIVFTRDGSPRQAEVPPFSMAGTSWITTSSRSINADGERSSDGNEYVLDFDKDDGDLIHGESAYGTRSANVFLYYMCDAGNGNHRMQVSWDMFHSSLSLGMGILSDGELHLFECYVSEDGTPMTSATVLKERTADPEVDIMGHWYICYSTGYDSVNGYMESTYYDSPDLASYDIDVLRYNDGLIYGEYMGSGISASYANGFLNMDSVSPGGDTIKTVRGWFDNDVMVLIIASTGTGASENEPFSIYYAAYSKVRAPVTLNTPETVLTGKWTSESYIEYLLDGTVLDLGHVDVEIDDDVRKNVFTGNLGGLDFGGIYLNIHGGIAGVTADSLGRQWYVSSDGVTIRANTIDLEMIGADTVGDISVVFVRDEAHSTMDVPYLSGKTYSASGIRFQYNDGGLSQVGVPISLTIDGQYGNCIVGQCALGNSQYDIMGSIMWINETLVVRINLQNGPEIYGIPMGYLTLRDGTAMLSIHTMSGLLSATGLAELTETVQ